MSQLTSLLALGFDIRSLRSQKNKKTWSSCVPCTRWLDVTSTRVSTRSTWALEAPTSSAVNSVIRCTRKESAHLNIKGADRFLIWQQGSHKDSQQLMFCNLPCCLFLSVCDSWSALSIRIPLRGPLSLSSVPRSPFLLRRSKIVLMMLTTLVGP